MERKTLPLDVIQVILKYTDQQTRYTLGLTNRQVSQFVLQKLWNDPLITDALTLSLFGRALRSTNTVYPYKKWIKSLSLHMMTNYQDYSYFSDDIFDGISLPNLKTLSLQQIDVDHSCLSPMAPSPYFEGFLVHQLNQGLTEIHIHVCSSTVTNSLVQIIRKEKRLHLKLLCFIECAIYDYHIERISEFTPNLTTLRLDRCGCFSDDGLVPVAKNCQNLCELIVTLPSNIVQSNTITLKTISALKTHCLLLETFTCNGQVRIIEHVKEENEYTFDINVDTLPLSCT